jgi:hypothetical protein
MHNRTKHDAPQSARRLIGLPFARLIDPRDPAIERMLQDLDIGCEFAGDRAFNCDVVTLGFLGNTGLLDLKLGCLLTRRTMKNTLPLKLLNFCIDASTKFGPYGTDQYHSTSLISGFSTSNAHGSLLPDHRRSHQMNHLRHAGSKRLTRTREEERKKRSAQLNAARSSVSGLLTISVAAANATMNSRRRMRPADGSTNRRMRAL